MIAKTILIKYWYIETSSMTKLKIIQQLANWIIKINLFNKIWNNQMINQLMNKTVENNYLIKP